MNSTARIVSLIMLGIGLFLIMIGVNSSVGIVSLWSDFKAYSARVASHPELRPALLLGGESDEDDLKSLIDRLWQQGNGYDRVTKIGFLQLLIGGIGLWKSRLKRGAPNNTPEGIRQPTDVLPNPSA